jgi:hypothetical protein
MPFCKLLKMNESTLGGTVGIALDWERFTSGSEASSKEVQSLWKTSENEFVLGHRSKLNALEIMGNARFGRKGLLFMACLVGNVSPPQRLPL